MGCDPRPPSSIGPRAASRARAGCKFVLSTVLAAVALFTASTVSTHAQITNWTGAVSNGWFNAGNWDAGVPNPQTSVNIDTVTPNSTQIRGAGAAAFNVNVGQFGTGMLVIQNGGTLTDHAGDIGFLPGSQGTAVVSGAGSSWTNSGLLVIGFAGLGTLTIQNGGVVNSDGGSVGLLGSGTVRVAGSGSTWSNSSGLTIGNLGTGTLTIAEGGVVTAPTVVIANNAGAIGTLNIGAGAGNPAAAPGMLTAPSVAFGAGIGTINFNHTSADYVFAPAISGNGIVNVLAGTTTLTGANSYSGPTNVNAGTLRAGALNTFSPNSAVAVAGGGALDLNGFSQTVSNLTNAGLVNMGTGTAPGTVLTTTSYMGTGGKIAMNTFLAGDGSPSDKLAINGGTATGTTSLLIHNAGGPGLETTANGILVVNAISGATTAPGAFTLDNPELRAGAFDYRLFRGGLNGSDPNDWFLRSNFITGPGPVEPIGTSPPPDPLPPGVWPIIGPELATYGVVQPIARQMGLQTLGTLHERIGDTLTLANTGGEGVGVARSDWARFFGQGIDNRYQAFADPRASGWTGGFQGGVDVWRGSLLPGHRDAAGVYVAFANSNIAVDGLVTNAAATGYVQSRTGTLGLNAYSTGGYWTHYGPSGWYLDAVMQGTYYNGNAMTQFASLPINGSGFISSLEAGYPIPLPLGPRFVLEPEAQIIWQQVSFNQANDGLGAVALGTTSGSTGRLGLRGMWTIVGENGQVWQPYARANVWRDWGAEATTTFGIDPVPLIEEATRLEFAGGVTARLGGGVSLYAQAGYQFALDSAFIRNGIQGDIGLRYVW